MSAAISIRGHMLSSAHCKLHHWLLPKINMTSLCLHWPPRQRYNVRLHQYPWSDLKLEICTGDGRAALKQALVAGPLTQGGQAFDR